MNRLLKKIRFTGLMGVFVFVLAACTSPPETKTLKIPYLVKTECELVYRSKDAQVVENFCETDWKPVKLYIGDQKYSIDWIDEKTSRRVFDSGCGRPAACYYELKMDGFTVNGRFAYVTDLLQGDFTFQVDANENLKLLTQTATDLPY